MSWLETLSRRAATPGTGKASGTQRDGLLPEVVAPARGVFLMKPPHRKSIKHVHEPGHLHEFTFSCYQRRPLLTRDDWRWRLSESLDEAGRAEQIDLVAFVYMPEHVHLLVLPRSPQPELGRYLARIKLPVSRHVKESLTADNSPLLDTLIVRERPGKTCFRFWQEGAGYDRNVFSRAAILASIDYLHANPVRRGLCERATDWPWSSARYYLGTPPRQQHSGLPNVHGLPADCTN